MELPTYSLSIGRGYVTRPFQWKVVGLLNLISFNYFKNLSGLKFMS